MARKVLTDKEILSIFVSYLDQDILVQDPLTRVSPMTLEWLNGLYYGENIVYDTSIDTYVPGTLGECRIILKPLKITDELCLAIGNDFYMSYEREKKITTVRNQLGALKFGGQCDHRIIAKLKEVGFAIPYAGLDLFRQGIAISEEDASNLIKEAPELEVLTLDREDDIPGDGGPWPEEDN